MKSSKVTRYIRVAIVAGAVLALAACGSTATATPNAAETEAAAAVQTEVVTSATESAALSATLAAPAEVTVAPTVAATASSTTAPTAATIASSTAAPTATTAGSTPAAAEGATPAATEGIVGHWEGAITVQSQDLGIVVDFASEGDGYTGTMAVPAQSAYDLPLSAISFEAPALYFEAFSGSRLATFEGTLAADGTISGTFTQAGFEGTFALAPAAAAEVAPVSYGEEEVTFTNGDASLAGTLTIPEGDGPFPAVVLISGSGQQNRDEELLGFKVFAVIADYLTNNGIAVLRYDDRGVGGSTGEVDNATSEDFAGDVVAAVEFLSTRPEVDAEHIGLIGHSEGGIIAPMVANQSNKVAFVVLLAGPAMPGNDLLLEQVARIYEASGASEAEVEAAVTQEKEVLQAIETGQGWEAIGTRTATQLRATVEAMPTEQRGTLGDVDEAVTEGAAAQIAAANSAWMRYFVTYDPVPALQALSVPALALYGTKDTQVAAESNSAAMKAALEAGNCPDFSVEVLMDANHLFQKADTGSPNEYGTLPKEFVPGFLDVITGWVLEHTQAAE